MSLPIKLAGLGAYLPERVVSSGELEKRFGIAPGIIERTTGIAARRYITGETQVEMGAAAARQALAAAGYTVDDVDLIIAASAGPQQAIPCTAALLQRELRAPVGRSACFDVNATCLSFMVALWNAAHLLAAGAYHRALIVSADVASASLDPDVWEATALFGDAAAAAVVERSDSAAQGIVGARFGTWSDGAELIQIRGGGSLNHPNAAHTELGMNWFAMQGPLAFRFVLREIRPFLDGFLDSIGWSHRDVDVVIPHQANRHAIEQAERLGFTPAQLFSNLGERGNCVAASVPLALAEAEQAGRVQRGNRVLLIGTGAGITLGALALQF